MKFTLKIAVILFCLCIQVSCDSSKEPNYEKRPFAITDSIEKNYVWKAKWISADVKEDSINTWINFRRDFEVKHNIKSTIIARIAADSKYWLWINGKMIVFEGGVKRGPNPEDTYYDKIDISNYLHKGKNSIAILLWYFGKHGFSHNDSGKAGLLFEINEKDFQLFSDIHWKAWINPGYGETTAPFPNYRLSESNVFFNAQKSDFNFVEGFYDANKQPNALVVGHANSKPWNRLHQRSIPLWKDTGLKPYENSLKFPFTSNGDTLRLKLPYNSQITPYLKIDSSADQLIDIRTNNYRGGGPPNVRAEYLTKKGIQSYESFGWMSGETVQYFIPRGIKVLDLKYRETGYDTDFNGSFKSDNNFYNKLWEKSKRTLYVTMRDNFMDCPDRERAQWWGDVVLESGEAFYALSPSAHKLTKKGILELINWQRADHTIFSPVPSGNWHNELPTQMLSSIGTYGFWNYYWHTGDIQTIKEVYKSVGDYLSIWNFQNNGTLILRKGGWTWGDWGDQKDIAIIFNTQYYMALDSFKKMSELLGYCNTVEAIDKKMKQFKKDFNRVFWQGTEYRTKNYMGLTDDRSQGLAVVSGLADKDKYPYIYQVLKKNMHASPYMEKYVLEALFQMGYDDYALFRMKDRFSSMVNHPNFSTMWEGWGIGDEGYGGGTTNHAWSGGGLTLLSQYVAGIYPSSAAYESINIKPQLGGLKHVSATVHSVKGLIEVNINLTHEFNIEFKIPNGATATIYIPSNYNTIEVDEKLVSYSKKGPYKTVTVNSSNRTLRAY